MGAEKIALRPVIKQYDDGLFFVARVDWAEIQK